MATFSSIKLSRSHVRVGLSVLYILYDHSLRYLLGFCIPLFDLFQVVFLAVGSCIPIAFLRGKIFDTRDCIGCSTCSTGLQKKKVLHISLRKEEDADASPRPFSRKIFKDFLEHITSLRMRRSPSASALPRTTKSEWRGYRSSVSRCQVHVKGVKEVSSW